MKNLEKWKSRRELKGQKQKSVEEKRRCVIKEAAEGGTLEDYSSSSVPQFFTSIAQPEVQAQTITYPPSLI